MSDSEESEDCINIYEIKTRQLAKELKSHCYLNGKERDATKSAEVIHKLGQAYREIADEVTDEREKKISLIRSAVLFNAAVVRKPNNIAEVQRDLDDLCTHVLRLAGCEATLGDMRQLVENCMNKMQDHRHWVITTALEALSRSQSDQRRIDLTEKLQNIIAEVYTSLMSNICQQCIDWKGAAPCKFALVGMGSLARREITPYSDFEHIYLLEEGIQFRQDYHEILEYFRWLAIIFQVVIVNFGETIIPSVCLPFLNEPQNGDWFFDAYTPRGISFDGMMPHASKFPLGRSATPQKPWETELIKPVSQMLKYLDSNEDLKNGYHLGDILTKICFVFGDQSTYEQMKQKTTSVKVEHPEKLFDQIAEDITNFNVTKCLNEIGTTNTSINIKQVIFRSTTLFIAALGRLENCMATSSFGVLRELRTKTRRLSQKQFENFSFALAFSCEVRLRIYSKYSSQYDYVDARNDKLFFSDFLLGVFGPTVVTTFFANTTKLQVSLFGAIDRRDIVRCHIVMSLFSLRLYDKAIRVAKYLQTHNKLDIETWIAIRHTQSRCLVKLEKFNEAAEGFVSILDKIDDVHYSRPVVLYLLSGCYIELEMTEKAVECLESASHCKIRPSIKHAIQVDLFVCYLKQDRIEHAKKVFSTKNLQNKEILKSLCEYYCKVGDFDKCYTNGKKLIRECKKAAFDEHSDHVTARELVRISGFFKQLGNFTTAKEWLNKAERIVKSELYFQCNDDIHIPTECKRQRADIAMREKNFSLAYDFYREAFNLYPATKPFQEDKMYALAQCYIAKATQLNSERNHVSALKLLMLSVSTLDSLSQTNKNILQGTSSKINAAVCLNSLSRFQEANDLLRPTLDTLLDLEKCDKQLSNCFAQLILCSPCLGNHLQTVEYFERGKEGIQLHTDEYPTCLFCVASSLKVLGRLEEAVIYFQQSITACTQSEHLVYSAFIIAFCHKFIGECYFDLKQYNQAKQSTIKARSLLRSIDDPLARKALKECELLANFPQRSGFQTLYIILNINMTKH